MENGVAFTAYGGAKSVFHKINAYNNRENPKNLPAWQLGISSALAGACQATVLTPVELIKCRLQVQSSRVELLEACKQEPNFTIYRGSWHCFIETVKEGGIRSLYRGNVSTLCRDVPGSMVWFGAYELSRIAFSTVLDVPVSNLPSIPLMASGACAGIAYWTCVLPVDTIKSVLQTEVVGANQTILGVFKSIVKTEGLRGLYRGYTPTVLRAIPSNACIFWIYEMTARLLSNAAGLGEC
eukprot:CAMPEP_0174268092 /NCGR_PEP_ID=MMETSP0439-20130205/36111_1 /TAXON_ID=0 /ORGANISM="Stereomyxa ramosa, Strain Chinc5" /LENGTH=238 /DNA_ID=CAMNT_0015356051 /DNA_START=350 /DNA_END=1066 /DNA_ORIENTATION=+